MITTVILGAGGHALSVLDAAFVQADSATWACLDDNPALVGTNIANVPIIGPVSMLPELAQQGAAYFIVGVGSNFLVRQRFFREAVQLGLKPGFVYHQTSYISSSARIGAGTVVLAGATVGPEAQIGTNCIVNTGGVVEHNVTVGENSHIAPHATLLGGVTIGKEVLIGAGAVVLPGVSIGDYATVGAGAVVVHDVPEGAVVKGVPARKR